MEGMNYPEFFRFIRLLSDNDLLKHVIVIGSWAEYVYAQAGVLPGFTANFRTLDIDLLIRNLRRPPKKVSLTELAKEAGYIIDNDIMDGTTRIYTPDLMEIEFLINQQGSGEESVMRTNLGVNAQALRHLHIVRDNTITANLFGYGITVPEPEAYVLHKLVINDRRGNKAEKDAHALRTLMPYISKDRFEELRNQLTKKEQQLCSDKMKELGL